MFVLNTTSDHGWMVDLHHSMQSYHAKIDKGLTVHGKNYNVYKWPWIELIIAEVYHYS